MKGKKVDDLTVVTLEEDSLSDVLSNTVNQNGLVVFTIDKGIDARPSSLMLASRLSTGGTIGTFNIPLSEKILYVEGDACKEEVEALVDSSKINIDREKVGFYSFMDVNKEKDGELEEEHFLTTEAGRNSVTEVIAQEKVKTVIIHTMQTNANFFLSKSGSEKDMLSWFRKTQRGDVALFVFAESGCKGLPVLKSMADVIVAISPAAAPHDALINVECIKYPAYEINEPQPFCLSLAKEQDNTWDIQQVKNPDQTLNLVIEMAEYGMTQEKIAENFGMKQYQVSRMLRKAEAKGIIVKDPSGIKRVGNMH